MTRTGFTLVELLVVIAIIAVGLSVATPAFQRDRDTPLAAASRTLVKLLEAVHLHSLRYSKNLSLVVDPQLRRYWIIDRNKGEIIRVAPLDSALLLTMSTRQVYEFSSNGLATPDTTVLALMPDTVRVIIEPLSGKAHVFAP